MHWFWFLIYNTIVVPLIYIALMIGGLFSKKIALGIRGRKNLFNDLEKQLFNLPKAPICWFHVASVGEFEQAKPVIEYAKKVFPDLNIIVSFFSPSGYENVRSFPGVEIFCYLPFDSYFQTKKFLQLISPDLIVVIRHDIWPNYVWYAHRKAIPQILIDASVSAKTMRLWCGLRSFNKDVFKNFDRILAISEENKQRLLRIYPRPNHISVCGDTRYDQVYKRTQETGKIDILLESGYFANKRVFVAGSTWPSDEKHVLPAVDEMLSRYNDFIAVMVPHEPTLDHLEPLIDHYKTLAISTARFTELENQESWNFRVLVVDCMGLLANIYAIALVAYVGGSFGPGVHNVLEPVAHGIPVLFGPRHLNSFEAQVLIKRGAGFSVQNSAEILDRLEHLLKDPAKAGSVGKLAKAMVLENIGASEKTVQVFKELL